MAMIADVHYGWSKLTAANRGMLCKTGAGAPLMPLASIISAATGSWGAVLGIGAPATAGRERVDFAARIPNREELSSWP